jgi:hypothetical protein
VFRYDRNHEGMDDEYIAEVSEMGLEFIFDSSQRLTTLFMKNVVIDRSVSCYYATTL